MPLSIQERDKVPIISEVEQRKAVLQYVEQHLECSGASYTHGAILKLSVNDLSTGATFDLIFSVRRDIITGECNAALIDIDPVAERGKHFKTLNTIKQNEP